jgi:YHS domain-containing protein
MNRLFIILFLIAGINSYGQPSEVSRKKNFNLKFNVAIQGYDPVSYFSNKPMKGSSEIAYRHDGVIYYFINEMNRAHFISTPKKYEPVYGGWCAYAMGLEDPEKVGINPKTYKILDNRLYLFYYKYGINTLNKWNDNEVIFKKEADKNWNKIIKE